MANFHPPHGTKKIHEKEAQKSVDHSKDVPKIAHCRGTQVVIARSPGVPRRHPIKSKVENEFYEL